jgi:chemotaxis signal transduction protein
MEALVGQMIVRCADRIVALPLDRVTEVFQMVALASAMPGAPRYCIGVVDWHGQLVPVFDLAARLGLCDARDGEALVDGHVVLVEDSVGRVGYAVDEVRELSHVAPEAIAAAPAFGRLVVGAVATGGGVAPLIAPSLLLTAVARHRLRVMLDQARGAS